MIDDVTLAVLRRHRLLFWGQILIHGCAQPIANPYIVRMARVALLDPSLCRGGYLAVPPHEI
jgi:hypothetical protein